MVPCPKDEDAARGLTTQVDGSDVNSGVIVSSLLKAGKTSSYLGSEGLLLVTG